MWVTVKVLGAGKRTQWECAVWENKRSKDKAPASERQVEASSPPSKGDHMQK